MTPEPENETTTRKAGRTTRNKAADDAPLMEGQTSWTNTGQMPRGGTGTEKPPSITVASPAEAASSNGANGDFPGPDRIPPSAGAGGLPAFGVSNAGAPERSNAGGKPAKGKGPRKPRSPARAAVYVERIIMGYTLEQRKAIYAMLSSVCQATPAESRCPSCGCDYGAEHLRNCTIVVRDGARQP